jgi:dolichol-phosphate mannosyltransferase
MPPRLIKHLLDPISQGYDVAVGSRFIKGGGVEIITESSDTLTAYVMSMFLNRFIQIVLGASYKYKDYTSGFIAIKRSVLREIKLTGDYGEYFIDLIYRVLKKGFKVKEIPYVSKSRMQGTSKTGTSIFHYFKKGIKYIAITLKLRFTRIDIFSLLESFPSNWVSLFIKKEKGSINTSTNWLKGKY